MMLTIIAFVQQVCSLQFSQVAHSSKLPNVSLPEQPTLDRLLFACAQAKAPCKVSKSKTHQKTTSCSWFSELNPQNGVYTIVCRKLANCLSSTSRWFLVKPGPVHINSCLVELSASGRARGSTIRLTFGKSYEISLIQSKNVKNISVSRISIYLKNEHMAPEVLMIFLRIHTSTAKDPGLIWHKKYQETNKNP